ncbi:MAG: T9SS C-terminal target domain-containing protein [Calditrichaeota bacterium]|nr:MAG: T9SS C-terminal target domain-containing protein [Calditrichota bacterium]MBL1207945.1 T9SS C-terminal target domain-containing protein [Calditrichota bacterium]NOG47781.1 T9SS type A sorting domain-containing protein [Calditrichota bacterium]
MKKRLIVFLLLVFVIGIYSEETIELSPDVIEESVGTINASMRVATGIIEGGKNISASGTLKIPIVFVMFADDNFTSSHWPDADAIPDWASLFVSSKIPTNNLYLTDSFSKFYDLSSGGDGNGTLGAFQVIGDVYFIKLSQNRAYYQIAGRGDKKVSEDVIDILDDPMGFDVDFREYDNWEFKVGGTFYDHDYRPFDPATGISADGKLDFMLIYWKEESITSGSNVGGYAGLGFSGTVTKDGIGITSSNGVTGFHASKFGARKTMAVSAHEIGHHQFGIINGNTGSHFDGRNDGYGNIRKFGLMTRGDGYQFSAYERYRLGWLDPIIVGSNTNNVSFNETHLSSTNNAIIIPVAYNGSGYLEEYYLLENYHSTNAYSGANPMIIDNMLGHDISKGIIVYHVSEEDFDWPTRSQVDIETAEGLFDWDVIEGASTPSDRLDDLIAPGTPNENSGFDERDLITATAGTTTYYDYECLRPDTDPDPNKMKRRRYHSNDRLGDQEDLFSLNYKKVFTKWTNPSTRKDDGSDSNIGFEIVGYNSSTHQYTVNIAVNSSGSQALAPAIPYNLEAAWVGSNPRLTWETNNEPDMQSYKISKMIEGETGWAVVATVTHNSSLTTHSWTDVTVEQPGKFDPEFTIHYKVQAYDSQGKLSLYSNEDEIEGTTNYFWKISENRDEITIVDKYSLSHNYPNPFNPETKISFSLPELSDISLKVFNIRGKEIATLEEGNKESGHFTSIFDGSNLSSGIYIYRFTAKGLESGKRFSEIKRMLLIK